jgi:hypothetical protein
LAGGLSTIFFVLLILHEHISKIEIIYYGYIKLSLIFFALSIILLAAVKKFLHSGREIFSFPVTLPAAFISLLLNYAIIITFPVTIERSFSVYMLGSLYNKETDTENLERIVQYYFNERRLVGKRLEEQIATGSIIVDDEGHITMTPRGKRIVKMNALIGRLFNLDMENILPAAKNNKNTNKDTLKQEQ